MRLLHGSNVEIVMPNLKKCQSKNDFGCGFKMPRDRRVTPPQWNLKSTVSFIYCLILSHVLLCEAFMPMSRS